MDNKDCWVKDTCSCVDCNGICLKLHRLDTLYTNAFIPMQNRKRINLILDKDQSDKDAFNTLKSIENNLINHVGNGDNIFIYSSVTGNGKTSWSLRFIQDYINNTWYKTNKECIAMFISVPKYLLAIKDNISEKSDYVAHIKKYVNDCDLVVWDDIGTKAATTFEHENLLSIIDNRIANGLSNVYTSNLSPKELQESVGDRLYSRICVRSTNIKLVGKDKRGLKI